MLNQSIGKDTGQRLAHAREISLEDGGSLGKQGTIVTTKGILFWLLLSGLEEVSQGKTSYDISVESYLAELAPNDTLTKMMEMFRG